MKASILSVIVLIFVVITVPAYACGHRHCPCPDPEPIIIVNHHSNSNHSMDRNVVDNDGIKKFDEGDLVCVGFAGLATGMGAWPIGAAVLIFRAFD